MKHNLKAFMNGHELNAVYNGFTYMPFYLSHSNMSCFSHLWDYEPAPHNHWVPNYGLYSKLYFNWAMGASMKETEKYAGFKKTVGPPHYEYSPSYDPLEANEYLISKGVDIEAMKNKATGVKLIADAHH